MSNSEKSVAFKITTGYVRQTFVDGKCVGQEFIAGIVEWEDEVGNAIDCPENDEYQPFYMVQPQGMTVAMMGNLSEGYGAVGPFIDYEEACLWAEGQESWILTMQSPYDEFDSAKIPPITLPVIGTLREDGQVEFKEPKDGG